MSKYLMLLFKLKEKTLTISSVILYWLGLCKKCLYITRLSLNILRIMHKAYSVQKFLLNVKSFSGNTQVCEAVHWMWLQCLISDTRWQCLSHGSSQQRWAFSMLHVLSLFIVRIVVEMVTLKNRLNPQSDFLEQKRFSQTRWQTVFYAHTKNR